jgi:hypothetical protein
LVETPESILKRQIVRPKSMRWMTDIKSKESNCRWHCQEVRRECWIGHDSDEAAFCKRTSCPALPGIPREPSLHPFVGSVSWPRERNQDAYVQQKGSHSNSFSNSLIRSVVT